VDILLNFITAYHEGTRVDADVCFDQKKIALKYLKGFFIIDFLATFPFYALLGTEDTGANRSAKLINLGKGMKLLRGLKMLRIVRLQKFIRDIESNYNVHHGISRMFNIIVVVLLATHLVGCLWYFLGVDTDVTAAETLCEIMWGDNDIESWDEIDTGWVCREGYMVDGLDSSNNGERYVASLYWAFSTLTTVGYGDISANTIGEQVSTSARAPPKPSASLGAACEGFYGQSEARERGGFGGSPPDKDLACPLPLQKSTLSS
jgi:hyperpolarization activated cyclic nucleotide-gated potassium channel 1